MTNKIGAGVVRRFKPIFVHIFALHCNKNFEDLKAEYGLNIHTYIQTFQTSKYPNLPFGHILHSVLHSNITD